MSEGEGKNLSEEEKAELRRKLADLRRKRGVLQCELDELDEERQRLGLSTLGAQVDIAKHHGVDYKQYDRKYDQHAFPAKSGGGGFIVEFPPLVRRAVIAAHARFDKEGLENVIDQLNQGRRELTMDQYEISAALGMFVTGSEDNTAIEMADVLLETMPDGQSACAAWAAIQTWIARCSATLRRTKLANLGGGHADRALREVFTVRRPDGARVGRNDPCPCSSGKKYKRCCGR